MATQSKLAGLNVSPLYDVTIPSTQEKVKFRAYNVKEERALLTADEQGDGSVMIQTLNQVVLNCLTPSPTSLTSFDLEYIFAQIRSKSVGEVAIIKVGCDETDCKDVQIEYRFDLQQLQVVFPEGISKTIKLSDQIAVKMKYPSVEDSLRIEFIESETDKRYEAVKSQIDLIYNGDEVIHVDEEPKEAVVAFIDGLNPQQYRKLEGFFEEMPYLEGELKYRCTKCRKEHTKKVRGLANFF